MAKQFAERLRLPNANEFSPGQVDLRQVLTLAAKHAGDRPAIVSAIRQLYFSSAAKKRTDPTEQLEQQIARANNVLIGMKEYGLFDLDTNSLTEFGRSLHKTEDDSQLYKALALHILFELHGLNVIEAVQSLHTRRVKVTKESLASELRDVYGFEMPTATTRHQTLLRWLGKAGVVGGRYAIEEAVLSRLAGVGTEDLDQLSQLSSEKRAFLRTLREQAEMLGSTPVLAKNVLKLSILKHGRVFKREDQLSERVLKPLAKDGWIERELRSGGRGGSSGRVAATQKLLNLPLRLLTGQEEWGIPTDLRPRLRTPLEDVYRDLNSWDVNTKGIALELLAIRITVELGLSPVRFRERYYDTGGNEVDLIAEGAHLHFSRWLFQCKNTPRGAVGLSDLAKEVGMAVLLRAHVIVLVTTGRFAETVAEHARGLQDVSTLQVVLLGKGALEEHRAKGSFALLNFFHREAKQAMKLKRAQVARVEDVPAEKPPPAAGAALVASETVLPKVSDRDAVKDVPVPVQRASRGAGRSPARDPASPGRKAQGRRGSSH